MKKFFSGLVLLTAVVALTACEEDVPNGGKKDVAGMTVGKNVVAFYLGGNTTTTRADGTTTIVAPSNVIDLPAAEGDDTSLCLVETVSSLDDPAVDATTATRGTPVYTENFDTYGGGIKAAAVYETKSGDARTDLLGDFTYVTTGLDGVQLWQHEYSNFEQWPTEGGLRYFLQAPATMPTYVKNLAFDKSNGQITFSLNNYPTAATAQKDLLFTYKDITAPTKDEDNPVYAILFYHAFTGVKFKLGNAGDGITAITKVEMSHMLNDGTCTITPNYTDANTSKKGNTSNKDVEPTDDSKSAQCSKWTDTTGDATFTQEFGDFSTGHTYTKENSTFADSFYNDATDENNLNDDDASMTFFCIPRTFASTDANHVILKITYSKGDKTGLTREVDFTKALVANGTTWKAGELYTYTLTINDVDVLVKEEGAEKEGGDKDFSNDFDEVKKNVKGQNTGNCNAYIRAAIVANWYDLSERIVNVPWSVTEEVGLGHFANLAKGTDAGHWVKGSDDFSDDFYYYTYQVKPGKDTNQNLFDSYTTYHCDKYYGTTHLKMTIVMQAIQATKLTSSEGFGTAVVNGWDTTVLTTNVETPAAETPATE